MEEAKLLNWWKNRLIMEALAAAKDAREDAVVMGKVMTHAQFARLKECSELRGLTITDNLDDDNDDDDRYRVTVRGWAE